MKKIFATILAILLLFSFTLTIGCQKTEPQPAAAPPAAAPAPAAPAAAPAEPEKKAEEAKPAESATPRLRHRLLPPLPPPRPRASKGKGRETKKTP